LSSEESLPINNGELVLNSGACVSLFCFFITEVVSILELSYFKSYFLLIISFRVNTPTTISKAISKRISAILLQWLFIHSTSSRAEVNSGRLKVKMIMSISFKSFIYFFFSLHFESCCNCCICTDQIARDIHHLPY